MLHLNPDHYLQTKEGRVWTPERNAVAWERLYSDLEEALSGIPEPQVFIVCGVQGGGKTTWVRQNSGNLDESVVVVDAALPMAVHRAKAVELAKRFGARLIAVWIDATLEAALNRNQRRPEDERVPEASIRAVFERMEAPAKSEGFDNIVVVRS